MAEEKEDSSEIKVTVDKNGVMDTYSFEIKIKCRDIKEARKHYEEIKKEIPNLLGYSREDKYENYK